MKIDSPSKIALNKKYISFSLLICQKKNPKLTFFLDGGVWIS